MAEKFKLGMLDEDDFDQDYAPGRSEATMSAADREQEARRIAEIRAAADRITPVDKSEQITIVLEREFDKHTPGGHGHDQDTHGRRGSEGQIEVGSRVRMARKTGGLSNIERLMQEARGRVLSLETDASGTWATVDWTPADPNETVMDPQTGKLKPIQPGREYLVDALERE